VFSETLSESSIDLRARPISQRLVDIIQTDIQRIGSLFTELPHFSIRDKPIDLGNATFDNSTLRGRLMKLRDEIALQYNEGVTFVLDDALLDHIVLQSSLLQTQGDLLRSINEFQRRELRTDRINY
jgi:hypothetical protein